MASQRARVEAAATPATPEARVEDVKIVETRKCSTGLNQLDLALNGGFTEGFVALVGGTAGACKSTCMLQVAGRGEFNGNVLYISSEESQSRLATRAVRLGFGPGMAPRLYLLATSVLEDGIEAAERRDARFVVIDSLQTMTTRMVDKPARHPTTLERLMQIICNDLRNPHRTLAVISQISKEETFQGTMDMQHAPDCLLYFDTEGPRGSTIRTVRALKHRENPTDYVARLRVGDLGMSDIEPEDESGRDKNGPEKGERLRRS